MKIIYTIKIFEFTLTKTYGHFVLSVHIEMVSVDYLFACIYQMTLSRLGEAWADPTFHNIQCLMLR